ncbi:MAG: prepilin-type N-terminal cleavage/methylation domain-containing protein [Proteobacteria bacterium]|nr:prepilin-type N-terminal cleavage/methylation domain-containing protein [Pseudomonadota bacterium]
MQDGAPNPVRTRTRGFTLIELLVAIAILAVLAVVSWRGIDGMARAQSQLRDRADAVLVLRSALAQWNSDLDAAISINPTRPMDWNGRALRLTRSSAPGDQSSLTVVAWTMRTGADGLGRWTRWQSPPLLTRGDWQQAWQQAASWAGDGNSTPQFGNSAQGGSEVSLMPANGWQVLYFRNDLWTPAVPSEALNANEIIPNGIRLVLDLPPGPALSGTISLDWVRTNLTQAKS